MEEDGFNLAKDTENDEHIGEPNPTAIKCKYCKTTILDAGVASKVAHDVLICTPQDTPAPSNYWAVDSLAKFDSVNVYSRTTELKFLSTPCSREIIGYQEIKRPDKIFIDCDRVELA